VTENMEAGQTSIIRKASEKDLDAIMEIEEKCFPGPIAYSKSQLRYLLLHANSTTFVETFNEVIRGFVMVTYQRWSSIGHIETIDVDPAHAKLGIGLKLLTYAEDDMRKKGKEVSLLEVSGGNKVALRLYRKAGYLVKERIKRYYRYEHAGTRDALRMIKAL
jgi:[ribosomal protein S18]-alanine N-acetyltransferase